MNILILIHQHVLELAEKHRDLNYSIHSCHYDDEPLWTAKFKIIYGAMTIVTQAREVRLIFGRSKSGKEIAILDSISNIVPFVTDKIDSSFDPSDPEFFHKFNTLIGYEDIE